MMSRMTWLLVVLAGAAGTAARYGIALAVGPRTFPWATLSINVTGCFLIGIVLTLGTLKHLPAHVATALAIGFLGAFTTYSTFSWELFVLGRTDQLVRAALYLAASVVLGLLATGLGYRTGVALGSR